RKQQKEIERLHEQLGDKVVSISIDTDPNENEAKVMEHLNTYGYDWYFAVGTEGLAEKLVKEFGANVVNAPSAPVILICEDQKARILNFGIKSAGKLIEEVEKGCK
ncbi:MAG: TlpA family protein disulfide reductase, partial [Actinomycetia bacterium]|nr:TlpA family protein disulfide reductase [Actinomycetes bacterium]